MTESTCDLSPSASAELLTGVVDGVAHARLNRPRALNALTPTLVAELREVLAAWAEDDAVTRLVIDGAGEKGLCAGGDVRACRDAITAGDIDAASAFWREEYALIAEVAHHPKPVTVLQRGVVMGGGLGLSAAASERLVAPDARLAMPETQIGFAPDAGMMSFFSRAGALGLHLALTGAHFNAGDALALGVSDACEGVAPEPLWAGAEWLTCYDAGGPAQVLQALRSHENPDARAAADLLAARSPLMVCVAYEAWRRAATMTHDEVLAQDTVMAAAAMASPDFVEGVRAQLVDKDKAPLWTHREFAEVTDADVARFFA